MNWNNLIRYNKKPLKMYKKNKMGTTSIKVNDSVEGELIQTKIARIMNNGEPIDEVADLVFTERGEGVRPELDPRTDKWDVALDAMDSASKTHLTKRKERLKQMQEKLDGKTESVQGQDAQGATTEQ